MASTTQPTEHAAGQPAGQPVGATPPAQTDVERSRSLIFRAGGRVYCCEVNAVREVVPATGTTQVTRLPGAPSYVVGIMNVRGVIVTVIDAGAYLHQRPMELASARHGSIMLIDMGLRSVGLLVDTVSDVRVVREDEGYQTLDVRAAVARVIAISEDE